MEKMDRQLLKCTSYQIQNVEADPSSPWQLTQVVLTKSDVEEVLCLSCSLLWIADTFCMYGNIVRHHFGNQARNISFVSLQVSDVLPNELLSM